MITVLGASGFIGRHVTQELDRRGTAHWAPGRDERLEGRRLGDLLWCAGVTTDARARPLDAAEAHVGALERVLRGAQVDSVVYLSTTLFYRGSGVASESDVLQLDPAGPEPLYEATKAAGEALALASGVPALVLRLANVYGVDPGSRNFLPSIIEDALRDGAVTLRSSLDSARSYVGVEDVAGALLALMEGRARGIYNVAGPGRVSHREIAGQLAELTGCSIQVAPGAPTATAPEIGIAKLCEAIDYRPESLLDALPRLVEGHRRALSGALT